MSTEPDMLTDARVQKVAQLARLRLSGDEVAAFRGDLERVLVHIAELQAVDVKGIEATTHANVVAPASADVLAGVFRDDTPTPSLSVEQALKNAPERLGDGFGVPKMIGEVG